jgi:hypothetical protein
MEERERIKALAEIWGRIPLHRFSLKSNRYKEKLLKPELSNDSGGSTVGQKKLPNGHFIRSNRGSWVVLPVVGSTVQLPPDVGSLPIHFNSQIANFWNLIGSRVALLVAGSTG